MAAACSQKSTSSSSSESFNLDSLRDCVEQLYVYKDTYFSTHPMEEAAAFTTRIEKLAKGISTSFEDIEIDETDRASYFLLKGRTLNVSPHYSPDAEQALAMAVSLSPQSVEAWCELGECLCKKQDFSESKKCFFKALEIERCKRALRNLSMACRQESVLTALERLENVGKAIELAKEAVNLDVRDGTSWLYLGNAYLSSFFSIAQTYEVFKLTQAAYAMAEKDPCAKGDPELHHNRALLNTHECQYGLALRNYEISRYLNPVWESPKEKQTHILDFLSKVQDFILSKGKLKGKHLHKLIAGINPAKHLKKFQVSYEIKLDQIFVDDLKEGLNNGKSILGGVICSLQQEDQNDPFTFIMVDQKGKCVAVTVLKLAYLKGVKIGDYVAIPEPYGVHAYFQFKDKDFDFKLIRVPTPLILVVNGRKLDISFEEISALKSELLTPAGGSHRQDEKGI